MECPRSGPLPPVLFGTAALLVLLIGLDDPLDQHVADHVALRQAADGDVLHPLEHPHSLPQAGDLVRGQVDLGDVAGDDDLGAEARRVRNIFICSREVFWASSRMMKLSSSVRPRI